MITMCFFDKSNNSTIVNALKQKKTVKKTFHGYPLNGCIPKGYALQWVSPQKAQDGESLPESRHKCVCRQWPIFAVFVVCSSTNSGITACSLLPMHAAVPYILTLMHTEPVDTGCQFACWKFHLCNRQRERRLCCSISGVTAANIAVPCDPAEDNCFAIASKTCVIFQDTVHKIQSNLRA